MMPAGAKFYRTWCLVFVILVVAGYGLPGQVFAQAEVNVLDHNLEFDFGSQAVFSARFEAPIPIQRVDIFFRPYNAPETITDQVSVFENQVTYTYDLIQHKLPVFAQIEYWFRLTLEDGQIVTTPTFSAIYDDDRFEWQTLSDPPFRVHWYEGDLAFGQDVLDTARTGLDRASKLIDVPQPQNLDLYVYASGDDFISALQLAGLVLVAGHASPELGVVMLSLPPGPAQRLEMDRQIPHELMHVLLYLKLGEKYRNVPTWLNEGLSSMMETYPNPDYYVLLSEAVAKDSLLPMQSLCQGFSLEASAFYQSYAQSESFTRFLYENYGSSGLEELLARYADGVECQRGVEVVFGETLARLEWRWQRSLLGENQIWAFLEPVLPWLAFLLVALLVPLILLLGSWFAPRPALSAAARHKSPGG
jgi:hypothetical protein